jgi:hypothetical protein
MEQAVRDGIIDRNPGWQREYLRAEDELDDPRSLALPDWATLVKHANALVERSSDRYVGWGDVVLFAVCTAARIGEVSGCRVGDINRADWTWMVRRQTTTGPGGLVDKGTKGRRARSANHRGDSRAGRTPDRRERRNPRRPAVCWTTRRANQHGCSARRHPLGRRRQPPRPRAPAPPRPPPHRSHVARGRGRAPPPPATDRGTSVDHDHPAVPAPEPPINHRCRRAPVPTPAPTGRQLTSGCELAHTDTSRSARVSGTDWSARFQHVQEDHRPMLSAPSPLGPASDRAAA